MLVKERLFAHPGRPASYAAGGQRQVQSAAAAITNFRGYFADTLHLAPGQYTPAPLRRGAVVVAGTILGRLPATGAPHLTFRLQPAGRRAPSIDPKPILDGWKLLEATAIYRASGRHPFFGADARNPSTGQVLLMSKAQLQQRVLHDPHVQLLGSTRRQVQAGDVDRRILATIAFLSTSGLDPAITRITAGGTDVTIGAVDRIPIRGHQGPGSITDLTIRRLLTLQGATQPSQIISSMTCKGQSTTISLPDHADRIDVAFTPLYGQNPALAAKVRQVLQPDQWVTLINRIGHIPEPTIPLTPSAYAITAR